MGTSGRGRVRRGRARDRAPPRADTRVWYRFVVHKHKSSRSRRLTLSQLMLLRTTQHHISRTAESCAYFPLTDLIYLLRRRCPVTGSHYLKPVHQQWRDASPFEACSQPLVSPTPVCVTSRSTAPTVRELEENSSRRAHEGARHGSGVGHAQHALL